MSQPWTCPPTPEPPQPRKSETYAERQDRLAPLDAELAVLNAAVEAAIATRTAWMDAHMADYAKYRVGEVIYDLRTGAELGMVTELYRYWGGRDPQYDTSMSVEYRFRRGTSFIDNTSRHAGALWIGNAEELAAHHEGLARRARLTRPDGWIDWAKLFADEGKPG